MSTSTDQLKVLFLLHLPPPVHGSSIVGVNIKNSVLINKSFRCSYVNLNSSSNLADVGKINIKKVFGFFFTFVELFIIIIKKRPKLCYLALTTTGTAFYKDFLIVVLLKLFQVKLVYHLHNKGISLHQDNAINKFCYRFVFKNTKVILLSQYLYADIQSFVPQSNIYICPNGIDSKCVKKQTDAMKSSVKSVPQLLFLSNMFESKGVLVLLEALALLKQKQLKFECVFIGEEKDISSSQFDDLKNKLALNEMVYFNGKKIGIEKELALLKADIFVMPTFYSKECFPLVLLEAMSYSLPIVSTFEGGIPDIVDDSLTGFLVNQKDSNQLALKLELLIRQPELRSKMGASGRIKYEAFFTMEKFENRLIEILKQVC